MSERKEPWVLKSHSPDYRIHSLIRKQSEEMEKLIKQGEGQEELTERLKEWSKKYG